MKRFRALLLGIFGRISSSGLVWIFGNILRSGATGGRKSTRGVGGAAGLLGGAAPGGLEGEDRDPPRAAPTHGQAADHPFGTLEFF